MRSWLSVWLKPGDTIEHVLARNPRYSTFVLAALIGITNLVLWLIDTGWVGVIFDWRVIAGTILVGPAIGIVSLEISTLYLWFSGKIFGGKASTRQLRTLLAWSFLPYITGLGICLASLGLLKFAGATFVPQDLVTPLEIILIVFGFWSLIIAVPMVARVLRFGMGRSIACGAVVLLLAFTIHSLLKSFLFQPFNIPSGSSAPTLLVGDKIIVSKYAYGYSRFSLPGSPALFSGRAWAKEPDRGDLVVFRIPQDTTSAYVKRVIGLPGDHIQMINGLLHINGQPVKRERIKDFIDTDKGDTVAVNQWRETLSNGVSYNTLDFVENSVGDNTEVYTVPPNHYFMLGDNRDNSVDSRFSRFGMVPFENLLGRVTMIYGSVTPRSSPASDTVRFDRIGMMVR